MEVNFSFDGIDQSEFEDAVKEALANGIAPQIEEKVRDADCPTEGCDGTISNVEVWRDNVGNLVASGICDECLEEVEIDIDLRGDFDV